MERGKIYSRPKGAMSTYAFFVKTCRLERRKEYPDERVNFFAFSRYCAQRWKMLSINEKQRFKEMAILDRKRHELEMMYCFPVLTKTKVVREKKKQLKREKDPNAPKRFLSPFFWFCAEERPKLKEENPDYGLQKLSKELGQRWSEIDSKAKNKYLFLADRDKIRYEKEMKNYRTEALQNTLKLESAVADIEESGDYQ